MLPATQRETMMRRLPLFLLGCAAVGLAGCDSKPSVDLTNATPAEVANAMKESGATRTMVRPGKWSSTVSILEMDTSQLPPDMAARIKGEMMKPRTVEACLTPEEVDHPEKMLAQVPASCRYEHYKMAGGTVDGKMRCEGQAGVQEMTVQGTYGTDQYTMTITNKTVPAPGAPVAAGRGSKMKIESHRLGDCDGSEQHKGGI
jgi:hypothetical protein